MDPLWISISINAVLVCVTVWYAYTTNKMAKIAKDTANASIEQAKEMRQQRISSSQAVLWPTICGWSIHALKVALENIGNGPALDIDVYLSRGKNIAINDCEYKWYSYITANDKKYFNFLTQIFKTSPLGVELQDSAALNNLVGEYVLLVEWYDIYKSGPFFQAVLPFSLKMDSNSKLYAKEGKVTITNMTKRKRQNT